MAKFDVNPRRAPRAWLVLASMGALTGCFAAQNRPPPAPVPAERTASNLPRRAVLTGFSVEGLRHDDLPQPELARAFANYLEASTPFEEVTVQLEREGPELDDGTYEIVAKVQVDRSNHSTFVLDVSTLGVISPWWGNIYGKIDVLLYDESDRVIAAVSQREDVGFGQVLFSWLGRDFVEGGYRTLYALLFQAAADAMDTHWEVITDGTRDGRVPTFGVADRTRLDAIERDWDDARVRVLREPPPIDPRISFWLRAFGGVEAQRFRGLATIDSGVVDDFGNRQVIASGDAEQLGYRIALYTPPSHTGFSIYPVAGYFDQRITIEDFREEINAQENLDPDAFEIGATCRDLNANVPVSCDIPNAYTLDIQSVYLGARGGYDFVFGTSGVRNALSINAGVNAVEYRNIDVSIGEFRAQDGRWSAFRSFAVGMQGVIFFPSIHLGVRGVIDFERYLRFTYPRGLRFKGPSRFDPDIGRDVRPRLTVEDGLLSSTTFQISTFTAF